MSVYGEGKKKKGSRVKAAPTFVDAARSLLLVKFLLEFVEMRVHECGSSFIMSLLVQVRDVVFTSNPLNGDVSFPEGTLQSV